MGILSSSLSIAAASYANFATASVRGEDGGISVFIIVVYKNLLVYFPRYKSYLNKYPIKKAINDEAPPINKISKTFLTKFLPTKRHRSSPNNSNAMPVPMVE